jgi:hypothetical protein
MKRQMLWIGGLGIGLLAAQAPAEVQYQYVTDTPTIQAAPSAIVSVKIYLQEELSGSDSSILTQQDGLFSAGISVQRGGVLPAQPASLLSLDPATGIGGFNGSQHTAVTPAETNGFWNVGFGTTDGVQGTPYSNPQVTDATFIRAFLGTVNVQAGADAGTTSFTIDGFQDNTLTFNDGFDLDASSAGPPTYVGAGPTTFTVQTAAVPEPSTLGLLGLGAMSILAPRRRARKQSDENDYGARV